MRTPLCRPIPAIDTKAPSIQDIAIFHYLTKSKAEFAAKIVRGGGGGKHRQWKHFDKVSKCAPLHPYSARACVRCGRAHSATTRKCAAARAHRLTGSCAPRCRQSSTGGICAIPAKLAKQCCDPARYELPALRKDSSQDDDGDADAGGDDSDEEHAEAMQAAR